eukprot:6180213-Pleurochrysis_carterae.AAC.1
MAQINELWQAQDFNSKNCQRFTRSRLSRQSTDMMVRHPEHTHAAEAAEALSLFTWLRIYAAISAAATSCKQMIADANMMG